MSTSGQSSQLSKILSGEPLPRIPPVEDPELDRYHLAVNNYLRRLTGLFTDRNIITVSVAELNGFIEQPSDKDYTLIEYAEFDHTLERFTHKLGSGTCTVNIKLNGVALSGTGDQSASSTQGQWSLGSTAVQIGDRVSLSISGSSSPVDLGFTLKRDLSL